MKKQNKQSGQVLLIVILIATVLLTVGISISQVTTQENKIARLEDDSKRALAAAEAGLEAALQKQSGEQISINSLVGSGFTGQATVSTSQSTSHTTPVLRKDEQFTFYLTSYTPADPNDSGSTQQFGSTPFSGKLSIGRVQPGANYCDENSGAHAFAVELTFINVTTGTITNRKLIDPCTTPVVTATNDKVAFDETIDLAATPSDILILKILTNSTGFPGAKLGINNADSPQNEWYPQGKTIVSTATTQTGVTKKIQLFQSYPQLPAEFMMTSF